MDLKDILLQGEDSLPTLSSATLSAQPALPTMSFTGLGAAKFVVSGVMGVLGMFYLAYGKKHNDVEKMLLGAALTIASLFIF